MTREDIQTVVNAVADPSYSHSRAGTGLWRDVVWVYRRDEESPSGFKLAAGGDGYIVEAIIDAERKCAPLSPTERY